MTNELNQPAGTITLETTTGETIGLYELATDNDGNFLYEDIDGDRKDVPSNYRIKVITKPQHPTTDWHNLTEQVLAGANIDWEKLEGNRAKAVSGHGTLDYTLSHNGAPLTEMDMSHPRYWAPVALPGSMRNVLYRAWRGHEGWTLFIDRPVSLKRKTAAQLPTGTYFEGKAEWTTGNTTGLYVIGESAQGKFILNGGDYLPCSGDPHQWIVTKELGTFKPTN